MGKYTAWKIRTAICDDTVEDAAFIEKHIKDYFMKKSIPYECNVYQSSKALWYEIEDGQAFDLLFLDIEMQELNGFELVAKIQETAPEILIIFVSAYESYVYKSFEFRPFRFIPKQQMESMITQALEAAFREIVSRISEVYIAENQQGIEKIPFRKIVYIWRSWSRKSWRRKTARSWTLCAV